MNGRFREGSIFEGGQRGTPHPMPIDIFPRSWDNFNICDNIHRSAGVGGREKTADRTEETESATCYVVVVCWKLEKRTPDEIKTATGYGRTERKIMRDGRRRDTTAGMLTSERMRTADISDELQV